MLLCRGALGGAVRLLAVPVVVSPWRAARGGVQLVILPSPYRSFLVPRLAYIGQIREKDPDGWVTVLLPKVIPARWWQKLLHNQRALIIRAALLFKPSVIVTALPYHLER